MSPPSPAADVTISIVNYNHGHYLPACLEGVSKQTLPATRIIITDNASSDGSSEWLQTNGGDAVLILNEENRGYAGAHNEAFRRSTSRYLLALNCDVVLHDRFIENIIGALEADPTAGSACGRTYLGAPPDETALDSTGLFPDRLRRFHDRDHTFVAAGRRLSGSRIFGPSGSAAMLRASMLDDISFDGQYFDEDFFAYCEDADLAWRAQRRGWTSLYVPAATAWHVHEDMSRATSRKRDQDSFFRQYLLIRNRHLCFLKNDNLRELLRDALWIACYDLLLECFLLLRKPRLGLAWPLGVARSLGEIRRKRAAVHRRAVADVSLSSWLKDR